MKDAKNLPDLTQKQFNFVKGILDGMTASDAYRAAYDVENMATETIWVRASELRKDSKVQVWLARARSEALTSAVMTKEAYLQETDRLKELCVEEKNYGAAVKAHELAGKVMGHYVDKHEDVTPKTEADTALAELRRLDPELAAFIEHKGQIQ